jgi:hypothetical protein
MTPQRCLVESYWNTWKRVVPGEELDRLKDLAGRVMEERDTLKRQLQTERGRVTRLRKKAPEGEQGR